MAQLSSGTFVVRFDQSAFSPESTLLEDLVYLRERGMRPIMVAPDPSGARRMVRLINRTSNQGVCVSGADAATLPAGPAGIGTPQPALLHTLLDHGFLPVLEPIALAPFGDEIELDSNDVASAVASATEALRALFFLEAGGVTDPLTRAPICELTPSEALALADDDRIDAAVRGAMRAAANGVRRGVSAAQLIDGRIAHATVVELLTDRHIGTQVTGAVYLGGPARRA